MVIKTSWTLRSFQWEIIVKWMNMIFKHTHFYTEVKESRAQYTMHVKDGDLTLADDSMGDAVVTTTEALKLN